MQNQEAYLIIDVGTGNVRVAVAAKDGEILSIERQDVRYEKDERYPESICFDPEALWAQIGQLAQKALQRVPAVSIRALTATSQREGIVLLGCQGESLLGLPNIDHRGREWEHLISDPHAVYQRTGRFPTSLFSALKLVGLRERRPETWAQVATFLSISDWVQYRLSGKACYEHSQASETLLYDVARKTWSPELCALFDLDPGLLSPLQAAGSLLGSIRPECAAAWGLAAGAQVVVGGADTQLAVRGTGPALDDVVIVSGTTTPIIQLTGAYVTDERARTWTSRHTDDTGFMLEANAGVTGLNYQRLKQIFYPNESYQVIEQELAAMSGAPCVASLGSLIADERSPLTKGGFIFSAPVSQQLSRACFVWATLWDIACSIRENYKTLCAVTAHDRDYVWACGGGMQSPTLRRFIAGLLQKKVLVRPGYRQSSVLGGVYLCSQALGEAAPALGEPEVVCPEADATYAALYREWQQGRRSFKQLEVAERV